MSDQGIQIPAGTIVNGQPFVKYQELQKRIVELESQINAMATFPKSDPYKNFPDWIAPGKWVEDNFTEECRRISKVEYGFFYCDRFVKNDRLLKDTISSKTEIKYYKHYKPFTPPPCPELTYNSSEHLSDDKQWVIREGLGDTPVKAVLDSITCRRNRTETEELAIKQLTAVCEWLEKWGKK
jgi:hypothetical protein